MGTLLIDSPFYQEIDLIIPVPLHPRKERVRGYNQSEAFAQGIAQSMEKPWQRGILRRVVYTGTQTKKNLIERLENVQNAFKVFQSQQIEGKHILLVDDVITTGATLEACALALLAVKEVKVSIAALGFAGGV